MPVAIWNRIRGVSTVTKADLAAGLQALGLGKGDHAVVHTSLSSFGHVDGGPKALIEALLDAVGPGGTLMMPTATWRSSYLRSPDGPIPDGIVGYDPITTPCDADMGRVPEAFRHWPGARRSAHPLMSVAAVGELARLLTVTHPIDDPLRPYRTLADRGGRMLLLGVDHTRNTTIHAAEFMAELPHLSGPGHALVRDRNAPGGARVLTMPREPDCSGGFDALNDRVPRREQEIGGCVAWLLEGRAVLATALAMLRADPAALLCDHPSCGTCTRGRRMYSTASRR